MKTWLVILTITLCLLIGAMGYSFFRADYLYKLSLNNLAYVMDRMLTKPMEASQGALVVSPDRTAYIPIIFSDEITKNKYFKKTEKQWNEEGEMEQGYSAIERLFVPYEYQK